LPIVLGIANWATSSTTTTTAATAGGRRGQPDVLAGWRNCPRGHGAVAGGEHVRNRKGSCRSSWGSPTGPPIPPPPQQQQQQEVAGDSPTCSLDGATALEVMVPSLVVITFVTVKDLADQVGDPQRDPELGNKSTAAAATEGGMDSRTRPVVHCWPQVSLW